MYIEDPNLFEFQAEVIEVIPLDKGKAAATLAKTYFYPTGGGQTHDEGWIGEAKVVDVVKLENGKILHTLDRVIDVGRFPAKINADLRLINMQSHTAQHILSGVFKKELCLNTLSSKINTGHPSTIDLNTLSITESELKSVEIMANSIVQNNLKIKRYSISDKDILTIPFRRPPKVSGEIQVVEIDGFDYSACGGTHCDRTGSTGLIKILKTEIQNHKLRIHFVAGKLAMEKIQEVYQTVISIASLLETGLEGLEINVIKQKETIHQLQLKMDDYKRKYLDLMKDRLIKNPTQVGNISVVTEEFVDFNTTDIRSLTNLIRSNKGYLIVLSSQINSKLSMVVGCSDDIGLDATRILNLILAKYRGKGGGDAHLAQGGGKISQGVIEDLSKITIKIIEELL